MNLDKLILQKQNEAMHQNTLDIDWMNWEIGRASCRERV